MRFGFGRGTTFERVPKDATEARGQNRIQDAIELYRQAVALYPNRISQVTGE